MPKSRGWRRSLKRLPASLVFDVEAERARRSLPLFVAMTWQAAVPGTRYVPSWHTDEISGLLEAVSRFEETRLLITAPPRHTKSALVSVFFPAWAWLSDPELRFICVSNGQALADNLSVACRRLIQSDIYQQICGGRFELASDQNSKSLFHNTRGGSRQATSFTGPLTGFGADIIIVDDPHKAADAYNADALERTNRLFFQTLSTRLNDPNRSAIIVAAQRLARDDLAGELARSGNYMHACFHASYDPAHPYPYHRDPRTEEGEPLFPGLWNRDALEQLVLSPPDWAAQYQQHPEAAGERIFRVQHLRYYDPSELSRDFDDVVQAWDPTFVNSPTADYVARTSLGTKRHGAIPAPPYPTADELSRDNRGDPRNGSLGRRERRRTPRSQDPDRAGRQRRRDHRHPSTSGPTSWPHPAHEP